jgi:aminoglycoside 6'-N-acetyltransferase
VKDAVYAFRDLSRDDLPTIATWLRQPHVAEWWGDPEAALEEIERAMEDVATEPLMVELDGRPLAYLQSYDPHLEDGHPYADQPFGTLGLDLSIGDVGMVGIGHGSAILRQFVDILFGEGVPRVVIDPDLTNLRAIRAYEKAGFVAFDRRESEYGPALMMAIDNPHQGEDA